VAATLESVKKAIGKKSSSLAFAWLADLERKAGKPDVALDTVNTGLTYLRDYLPGLLVRSAIYFDLERYDDVIESCEAIVKKDPFCIAAWRRLGAAYQKKNQIGKRNFCYRMVHDMDPLDSFWKEEYNFVPPEDIVPEEDSSVVEGNEISETQDVQNVQEESFEMPPELAVSTPPDLENEDPFSLLTNLLPSDEDGMQDTSLESLESSLDDVMEVISEKEETLPEYFGGDDISETDVSSAFSSMFGMDDELPSEKPVSPFASFEIPTSIDDEEDASEPEPEVSIPEEPKLSSLVEEEKPQSLSSAFDDIFGADELPEEKFDSDDFTSGFEKSSSAEAPSFEESISDDFTSGFEKSSSVETPSFEESISDDFTSGFEKSSSVEAPSIEESISDDFTSGFEKSSSVETPSFEESISDDFTSGFEKSSSVEAPSFEESISDDFTSGFEKSSSVEAPSIEDSGVDIAPQKEESLIDQIKESDDILPEIKSSSNKAEPQKAADEFISAVDSSLSALFGEDDLDLPQEKESAPTDVSKNSIENSFTALFGEDDDLVLPSKDAEQKEKNDGTLFHSLEEDVDSSFESLFGKEDDSFELKKDSPASSYSQPVPPLNPVEVGNEISGAFATLFSSDEDDDLPEEKPQERDGVDFLMSGDSDDEMAVALMKNPSASLDQDEVVLDENLNTKTLAEIYYEQGLYSKALNIYQDLARKNPSDSEIQKRLSDIQRQVNEKYGDL
jgi:pilus assembly protein FimV